MNDFELSELERLEKVHWWYKARKYILSDWAKSLSPQARILDLGSATGGNSFHLQNLGFQVTSVELSDYGYLRQKSKGLKVVKADACALPFNAEVFDAVICLDLLEHVKKDYIVVDEIVRVAISGGKVLISVPEDMKMWSEHDVVVSHFRRYSQKEIQNMCINGGIKVTDVWKSNVLLKPLVKLQRRNSKGSALKELSPLINSLLYTFAIFEYRLFRKSGSGMTVWISGLVAKPE